MEIRTPTSKRHRHVNMTGGDRDDNEEDEDEDAAAILLKKNKPSKILISHWHQPGSRIYRVSRASGGKDRHSKVYTAKGLRDRRVRLSVSTAIQFYDLQDRLGYDQPSKAIEWLIKAADSAIAELPSLDMNFGEESASETGKGLLASRSEIRESSFTELLTGGGGGGGKYMPPVTSTADYFTQLKGGQESIPSEFGFGDRHPAEMQQFAFLQQDQFFPVGNGGGDSYFAGFHRGTLQSNSPSIQHLPFLFGTAASTATSAHEGLYPAGFDGHLQQLEMKGKGKG